MTGLQIIWYMLFFVLIIGYAILDGFDLGVGILHLFARDKKERQISINAIAPFWDGNEVWLLTAGGALFAAFPPVYATLFSSLYLPFMLLLFALIFRAVAIEFRGQVADVRWVRVWDITFGLASALPALLLGVALGNVLRGLPLDENMVFTGSFPGLLNPYALLAGVLSLVIFTMHGAAYLSVKTDGPLQLRMQKWISRCWVTFIALQIVLVVYSFFEAKFLFENMLKNPFFWLFFLLLWASTVYIPIANKAGQHLRCFLASSAAILCLLSLAAVGLFPRMIPSITNLDYSLTIYDASSTQRTLTVMLVIALVGMPIVIAYTAFIYRVFKGKAEAAAGYH
ncbi:cytochrome d ubiquinol oxidase subunit II [Planctomycetota bacterium]